MFQWLILVVAVLGLTAVASEGDRPMLQKTPDIAPSLELVSIETPSESGSPLKSAMKPVSGGVKKTVMFGSVALKRRPSTSFVVSKSNPRRIARYDDVTAGNAGPYQTSKSYASRCSAKTGISRARSGITRRIGRLNSRDFDESQTTTIGELVPQADLARCLDESSQLLRSRSFSGFANSESDQDDSELLPAIQDDRRLQLLGVPAKNLKSFADVWSTLESPSTPTSTMRLPWDSLPGLVHHDHVSELEDRLRKRNV